MPEGNESLILKEQANLESAPFLFPDEELPTIDRTRPKFHCTGERLWRDRPDVYKAVVKLLAEPGVSVRSICATCHVTDDTVRAVKARENISIAAQKTTVLSNITHGARLASERVIEMLPTASAKDALIGVGILVDKMQLLSGEVTARVENVERVDIFSDYNEFIKNLEKEPPPVMTDVEKAAWHAWLDKHWPPDSEPGNVVEMGLAGKNNFLIENGVADPAPAPELGPGSDREPEIDSESDDRTVIGQEGGAA